jgi:hypothetical protein
MHLSLFFFLRFPVLSLGRAVDCSAALFACSFVLLV